MSQMATYAAEGARPIVRQTLQESPVERPQDKRSRVESKLLGVATRSLHRDRGSGSPGRFDISADMDEVRLQEGRIDSKYTMSVHTTGHTQEAEFHGVASLWLTSLGPQKGLDFSDTGMINDIVMEIYRSPYETLYLLSRTLGLEPPTPGLVEEVHVVT